MRDPILHGSAKAFLPADHWLLTHWPEHDQGTDEISCSRCNHPVYHITNGTVRTWIETGFVILEAPDPETGEPQYEGHVYCIHCAAHMDYFNPVLQDRYWLQDDGEPQWDKADV